MSTDFRAIESSSDAVVLSEPPINSDIDVVNVPMVVDESLDSKPETLTTELSSGGIVVQDLVHDARVSGDETRISMDNDEKLFDESSIDAVVKFGINSDIDVVNSLIVVDESLDSKTETLTMEPSSGGIVVQDLVHNARVSGDETRISMVNDEKLLDESSIDAVVKFGADLLESKSGSLVMKTCDHDVGGDIVAQDSIGDVRVCRDETGNAMDNDEKLLDGSSIDAVVLSLPPAASHGVKFGADLLESKSGSLVMETSDHDGGGDNNDIVDQDSVGGARVSRDGTGVVTENSEIVHDLVDGMVSGDEIGIVMDNDRKLLDSSSADVAPSVSPAAGDVVNIGADLLESRSGTLTMESSDHDGGDDNHDSAVQDLINEARVTGDHIGTGTETSDHDGQGDIVAQDSVGDARVSRDGIGIVTEESELVQDLVDGGRVSIITDNNEKLLGVSSSDAVVSFVTPAASDGDKIGTDLLESKSGTLISESSDHDGAGDIVVQDSIDEGRVARVIGDEIGIAMENSVLVSDRSISDDVVSSVPLNNRDVDAVNEINIVMENTEKAFDENDEVINEEKEGDYKTTDIVWAKVKDYPWWPGQIFDPSSSTDNAKKYSNKKGFLVAYFGDQTFAWNKAPKIKPFRKNFSKLVKQSNSKAFFHAVNCALEEVSRRVEFGLACSCLSKEVSDKIKSQVFVNAGIRKEDSKIEGGDRFSTVSTFKPVKVVQSVQELAREHFDGFSKLDVLSVRTQLLAFFRWKGYYQFQTQNILDGLDDKLEDGSELPLTEEIKVVEDEKRTSVSKKVSSKKRKPDVCDSDDSVPQKKERSLTSVTPKDNSSAKRSKKDISKKATVDDNVFKEEKGNEKPASVGTKVSSKKKKPDVCDSDDSVPHKKERSVTSVTPKGNSSAKRSKKDISKTATVDNVLKEEKGSEIPASVGKKVSSKKKKPDVCDSDDSGPRKKERSVTSTTPKGNSGAKRSKKGISKTATVDNVLKEEKGSEKPASVGKKVPSKRKKPDVCDSDDSAPRKKERSLTDMTKSSVKRSKKGISKQATVDDKRSSISSPKKLFRVGDSISRIAKQISESPSILKKDSQKSGNDEKKTGKKDGKSGKATQIEE